MGFAVVADEVRNLAPRAAQAAKETSGKIENAVTRTAQGVQISEKVAISLQEIVSKARQVDELAAEVASASREQTQGIQQVNLAVTQMDKVTQANAANAEESASAAEELNAQAVSLKESVSSLLCLVHGTAETQTLVPRTTIPVTELPRHNTPHTVHAGQKQNGHPHPAPSQPTHHGRETVVNSAAGESMKFQDF